MKVLSKFHFICFFVLATMLLTSCSSQPQKDTQPLVETSKAQIFPSESGSGLIEFNKVTASDSESVSRETDKFWVPAYTRKSEIGRPVIIKGKVSTGTFEILSDCLVFINEVNGKVGAVLLGSGAYVSEDEAFIILAKGRMVPIGKRMRVGGYIRSKLFYETEYVEPPLPKTCPNLAINVGGITEADR